MTEILRLLYDVALLYYYHIDVHVTYRKKLFVKLGIYLNRF